MRIGACLKIYSGSGQYAAEWIFKHALRVGEVYRFR